MERPETLRWSRGALAALALGFALAEAVNDAIACRVPFVCVEEPNHWQVEMIRTNCEREHLTRTIGIAEFRDGEISEIMERELGNRAGNRRISNAMERIKIGQENIVARQIVQIIRRRKQSVMGQLRGGHVRGIPAEAGTTYASCAGLPVFVVPPSGGPHLVTDPLQQSRTGPYR